MSQKVLLTPEQVTATYDTTTNKLTIEASGREDGVMNIHIQEVQASLNSPTFMIIGEVSAAIGNFPYSTKADFPAMSAPAQITMKTTQGDKQYPVKVTASNAQQATAKSPSAEATNSAGNVGLFLAQYQITTPGVGGPVFTLHMTVNTPSATVQGAGNITQTTNPPLNIGTRLNGNFTYMTVMPNNSHILVTATGYPMVDFPPNAGIGPVLMPNAKLRMVLESDWKTGTAEYQYMTSTGEWKSIENAKVTAINCQNNNATQSIKSLAESE
jgi:hypothetical protein